MTAATPTTAALATLATLISNARRITPGGVLTRDDLAGLIRRAARIHHLPEADLARAYHEGQ